MNFAERANAVLDFSCGCLLFDQQIGGGGDLLFWKQVYSS